jgi:hypothetical protein
MLDLRKLRKRCAAQGGISVTERAPPDGAGNAATRGLTGSRFRLCLTIPPPPAAVHGVCSSWTATTPTRNGCSATIAPGDVRPATGPGAELDQVTARWVATASGLYRPAFTALPHPQVWLIGEQPREGTS